ncbi:DUF4268 domain-containing protein, partial [Streptococcus suis]
EEHRSAIEWLNKNTTKKITFLLIEIHAYQIVSSMPAPKFVLFEKPNDFTNLSKGNNHCGDLSKALAERLYFWTQFINVVAT